MALYSNREIMWGTPSLVRRVTGAFCLVSYETFHFPSYIFDHRRASILVAPLPVQHKKYNTHSNSSISSKYASQRYCRGILGLGFDARFFSGYWGICSSNFIEKFVLHSLLQLVSQYL